MPEPIVTQQAVEPTAEAIELETLRRVNAELTQKSATRKARIAELESAMTENQSKLNAANESLHQVTISGPLQAMAESISKTPELWLEQFQKSHRVAMVNGKLTIQSLDGKPMSVPFERQALIDHLINDAHPQSKVFKQISIVSRASGGAGAIGNQPGKSAQTPTHRFGLR